jgi:hypothetical protein
MLAATVSANEWGEERAHRWWDRHHPEAAGLHPADATKRMLAKTMDLSWEPVETPASELKSSAS